MTCKQVFKRYLKEIGYYGALLNFISSNIYGAQKCRRIIDECEVEDLYLWTINMFRYYSLHWHYDKRILYELITDLCENNFEIKEGDILTIKTQDGKYEYEYTALIFWRSMMKVETTDHRFFKIGRISKINGRDCNYDNCWKFKKNINNFKK